MSAEFTTIGSRFVNANGSHGNQWSHQSLMTEWKQRATIAIRQARCQPVPEPVTITVLVHRQTRAKSDAHNVMGTAKACIDAAVSAGLITDDNDDVVTATTIKRGPIIQQVDPNTRRHKAVPAITVRIEESR